MNLRIAEVISSSDTTKQGRICVSIDGVVRTAIYTSPYLGVGGEGGLVAVPEPGSKIIVAEEENGKLYYISTVSENPDSGDGASYSNTLTNKDVYAKEDKPQSVVLESPRGARLLLSDEDNDEELNYRAELKGSDEKKVSINETPEKDWILIQNASGKAKIKLQDTPSANSAANSIELESLGPQKIQCRESEIDIRVLEGREVNIVNESVGTNAPGYNTNHAGNINITSLFRDINMDALGPDGGRIFLDSDGLIQLDVDTGKIIINAKVGDIEINAPTGSITMNAGQEINLQAGLGINLAATNINIQASVQAYIFAAITAIFNSPGITQIGGAGNLSMFSGTPIIASFPIAPGPVIIPPPPFYQPKEIIPVVNYYGE